MDRHPGSERFHELLREIGELHDRKQHDYGRDDDPFANVRASEDWGVAPWLGALIRLNDKVERLKTFAQRGTLANEGVIDSLMDIAVYALIARVLFESDEATVKKEAVRIGGAISDMLREHEERSSTAHEWATQVPGQKEPVKCVRCGVQWTLSQAAPEATCHGMAMRDAVEENEKYRHPRERCEFVGPNGARCRLPKGSKEHGDGHECIPPTDARAHDDSPGARRFPL